jgi:hypothetical protein
MPAVFARIDPSDSRRARRRMRRSPGAGIALVVGIAMVASACSDDGGDAERFCGEVAANSEALTNPQLVYSDDIEPLLDLYREIGDLAPLAVEADWNQLVSAYETASTVLPGDQESEQEALAAIYSSEESAAAIDAWLRANCAVDIGPVFTIVPHTNVTAPVPTMPNDTAAP